MKDKGFRQIDNEYYLAIMAARLEGNAYQVLLAVIHFTLGYDQRDTAEISHKTFQELTQLSRNAVRRAISSLIRQGLISKISPETNRQAAIYRVNVDWRGQVDLPSGGVVGEPSTSKPNHPSTLKPEGSQVNPPRVAGEPSRGSAATPETTHIKKTLKKTSKERCDASITTGAINKSNNSQGDIPLKPPSKTTRKLSSNPYIAQLQEYLGFPDKTAVDPVPSPGKEAKAIKRMLDRGLSWEAILACWKGKVADRGEFVSMVWVNEDIGKKASRGAHRQSSRSFPKHEDYRTPEEIFPEDYPTTQELKDSIGRPLD